jgi:tetratricopeptide (TPR) repeat protein
MAFSVDQALLKAKSLAKSGDIQNAENIYLSILEKFPGNKRARHGLTALRAPRQESKADPPQDGINHIFALYNQGAFEKVLMEGEGLSELYPRSLVLLNLLGAANVELQNFGQAAEYFRRTLKLNSDYAEGHKNLGYALNELGRHGEAIECYTKALQLDPDSAEAHYNLGVTLHQVSDYEGAIEHYEKAIRLDPGDVEMPNNLGALFEETDRLDEAIACYTKALTLSRNSAVPHYNLGRVFQKLHRKEKAMEHYREAIQIDPDCAEALNNLGVIYQELNRCDEAIACLTESLRINPNSAEAHNNLGNTLQAIARADEAADCYRKALTLRPHYCEAHSNLSGVTKYKAGAPHISQMLELVNHHGLSATDRTHLNFALGKAFDEIGDKARAFSHILEGNRLFGEKLNYQIADDRRLFDDLKSAFSKNVPVLNTADLSAEATSQRPIFIVGMPRSGTSLVEQILAAHSQVFGAGELGHLGTSVINTDWSSSGLNIEIIRKIRGEYLAEISKISAAEPYVTDKMPLNFRWLGFVISALPEARIIHVKRDARAICWSIFKHYWSSAGNQYAYDLRGVAEYYKIYEDLMSFWHGTFPDRIFDLTYERLTEYQEDETRKLLEFIGIDWEEACLNFHELDRAVRTSSSMQVRQKMYQGSSEEWQKYADQLAPMFEALESR